MEIININKCRVEITDISTSNKVINVKDGFLDYCYVKKNSKDINNKIKVKDGEANIRVIDILDNSGVNVYTIDLENPNSNVNISIASISRLNSKKDYKVNTKNKSIHTTARIDCFGIVEDTSSLKYDITIRIF